MLRKSELEKEIMRLQHSAALIGLWISEFVVKDKRIIKELEKKDKGRILKTSRRPIFVSPANYKRLRLGENEYGRMFGIRFVKRD